MNIALPALVVFLVLLPGFIARSRIKHVEKLSLDYSPFGQVVSEAILWAGGMHVLWIWLTGLFAPMDFNADIALKLLGANPRAQAKALEAVAEHTQWITAYFGSLLLVAYLAPTAVRWLITRHRLDRINSPLSKLFRFSRAPWYYLLSGADFEEDDSPDFIAVSSIVNVAGQAYLYTGILDGYFIDHEGNLDRLILQEVMRRPMVDDKTPDTLGRELDRFYPIDGDYFVLRYSEAITLNIEYIKLTQDIHSCDDSIERAVVSSVDTETPNGFEELK